MTSGQRLKHLKSKLGWGRVRLGLGGLLSMMGQFLPAIAEQEKRARAHADSGPQRPPNHEPFPGPGPESQPQSTARLQEGLPEEPTSRSTSSGAPPLLGGLEILQKPDGLQSTDPE